MRMTKDITPIEIENMDELERRINSVCAGESTLKEHELIEVD